MSRALPLTPGRAADRIKARRSRRVRHHIMKALDALDRRREVFDKLAAGYTPSRVAHIHPSANVRAMMAHPRSMREAYIAHEVAQQELSTRRMAGKARVRA